METSQVQYDEKPGDYISQVSAPAEASTAAPKSSTPYVSQDMPSTASTTPNADLLANSNNRKDLPAGTSLAGIFRYHMGIEHDISLVPGHLAARKGIDPIWTGKNEGRRAVNLGIYNRAIREERTCAWSFRLWSVIINMALGLQIIFAAILTALGAGSGPADAVAAFGTLNTIIAGFLTYLKGTGLPGRHKYFGNQWLKLRAYIEQRERDFASDDSSKTHRIGYKELMEEVDIIENMYHNIRKDIEKHTPDSFAGSKGESGGSQGPGEGAPPASLAQRGLNALRSTFSGAAHDANQAKSGIEDKVKNVMEDVEKRISGHLAKMEEHNQNRAQQQRRDVEKGPQTTFEEDPDAATLEIHDVSDLAMEHMRKTQAQAIEAQEQAERKVKELEERLAHITETVTERVMQRTKENQASQS